MFQKLLWIALAGASGTVLRFVLAGVVQSLCGQRFPWGTLVVNCLGCFVFGVFWSLAESRLIFTGQTRFILLVGFLGAFTTFSTFAFETGQQLRDAQWLMAGGNVLAHNVIGITLVILGIQVGRWL
jgi:CrcB protein